MTEGATPEIAICFERPDNDDGQRLIQRLDEDILLRYPALRVINGLRPHDQNDPNFTFVVARINRSAVGCGALRTLEPGIGEVKRMFVDPRFRRHGIARRILNSLERRAGKLGFVAVRLETGREQPEAIALYKSAGYREIPCFGEYANNSVSVCFEKLL